MVSLLIFTYISLVILKEITPFKEGGMLRAEPLPSYLSLYFSYNYVSYPTYPIAYTLYYNFTTSVTSVKRTIPLV